MLKFYSRDGVFNFMSDFNYLFFNKSHKKSLKQANKSFRVGIGFGITGLLFFITTLAVIYLANTNTNFTTLNKNFDDADEKLDDVIGLLRNNNNADKTKILEQLDELENKLNSLSIRAQKDLTRFSNNSFVIVSLLGGGFLEIIAIINFYQCGKVLRKNSDSIDRNYTFHLAYSIYEKLDNELEKKAFLDLMQKIIPNVQSTPTDTKHPNKDKNNGRPKQPSDS